MRSLRWPASALRSRLLSAVFALFQAFAAEKSGALCTAELPVEPPPYVLIVLDTQSFVGGLSELCVGTAVTLDNELPLRPGYDSSRLASRKSASVDSSGQVSVSSSADASGACVASGTVSCGFGNSLTTFISVGVRRMPTGETSSQAPRALITYTGSASASTGGGHNEDASADYISTYSVIMEGTPPLFLSACSGSGSGCVADEQGPPSASASISGSNWAAPSGSFQPYPGETYDVYRMLHSRAELGGTAFSHCIGSHCVIGEVSSELVGSLDYTAHVGGLEVRCTDPNPSLIKQRSGSAEYEIRANIDALARGGRGPIAFAAADGATQLLCRVLGLREDEVADISILRDCLDPNDPATCSEVTGEGEQAQVAMAAFGAIAEVVPNQGTGSFGLNRTITSVTTADDERLAFFAYRVPEDFPYDGWEDSVNPTDFARSVVLNVAAGEVTSGAEMRRAFREVFLRRPPVLVVHGLWDNPGSMIEIAAALQSRVNVRRANYGQDITNLVVSTKPDYAAYYEENEPATRPPRIIASALGFTYNAPYVRRQIQELVDDVRAEATAVSQVDVVAHSMGGLVARAIAAADTDKRAENFGHGSIHKLITLATPHWGSRIAHEMVQEENICLAAERGAWGGDTAYSFVEVEIGGRTLPVAGGTAELDPTSPALQDIKNSCGPPTAVIASTADYAPSRIAKSLQRVCPLAPMGSVYADAGRFAEFMSQLTEDSAVRFSGNDGLVHFVSATAGLRESPDVDQDVTGAHSTSTASLGFATPAVTENNSQVADILKRLLDTPVTNSDHYSCPR